MTLNVKQKRVNPDSTPSVSKSFIDKSMSSNTDKSEDEDVFDDYGEKIPKSPIKPPPGRTSFIQKRTSFIGVPGNSSGNSSDEEPRPTRKTFTGRKTIGEQASIDDDLEDILATQIRKSMIQARFFNT